MATENVNGLKIVIGVPVAVGQFPTLRLASYYRRSPYLFIVEKADYQWWKGKMDADNASYRSECHPYRVYDLYEEG